MEKILVIGACGQIGTELVIGLRKVFGTENVIASDVKEQENNLFLDGPYKKLDVLNREEVRKYIIEDKISQVYLLAALLSATAEKNPDFAWKLNMEGLFTILDLGKEGHLKKIYWPSSIAVFGPTTPKDQTPQYTVMEPSTVYGISKLAGERWCEYYNKQFDVDVRSIRYPGLISYTSLPGGGTTDYAVDIFYHAKKTANYTSFLEQNSALPMMFMEDAIRATIELMQAPAENVKIRSSYNLAGISFTPEQLAAEIKKHIPEFKIDYKPDFRQKIADSWPNSIDDTAAKNDWGWQEDFNLQKMVEIMLRHVDISKIN
ncbi:MAG: NAD-dependent epimerase/dehydratase family protein [Flavobacteriia bacterium]|jgi:nucleoside-diphosphate-sugar epimerase